MTLKVKGHIFAITTISIWGSTFIVSKVLLEQMSPLQILFYRFVMAVVFLTMFYPRFKKPSGLKEELLFMATGGCLALYYFFENSALKHTYSSNVSLILATIPLITALFSAILYKTPFFNKKNLIGFTVAYLGVFLIILNGNKIVGVEPIGDLFAFLAAVMFAVYSLVLLKIQKGYHLIELTRKVFFYGLMILGIVILASGESLHIEAISPMVIVSMLFLGLVASTLAFLMWNSAIQYIGSVKTNQYIYLVPVITTVLSAIVIKEKITVVTVMGAALIILGLYSTQYEKSSGSQLYKIFSGFRKTSKKNAELQ
jgi:drug/metabolite transporter (DMT)-like permease